MITVLTLVLVTLVVGAPTFWKFYHLRDQASPYDIREQVLLPHILDNGLEYTEHHIMGPGQIEIPILEFQQYGRPVCLSSITLQNGTAGASVRQQPVYATAIRIIIPVNLPAHQEVVMYRHPSSSFLTRRIPYFLGFVKGKQVLHQSDVTLIHNFVQQHNSLRYRAIEGCNPILVPEATRQNPPWSSYNMLLSVEYFDGQGSIATVQTKMQDLFSLADALESNHQ